MDDDSILRQREKLEIRRMLVKCLGNRSEAATRLGISRYTIYRKIDRYREMDEHDPEFLAWEQKRNDRRERAARNDSGVPRRASVG
jgi:DNA invertase Pin-like site-specific DNA recombinase